MLDYKYIEQLMERYFNCETTLEEEQVLRAFYSQPEDALPETLRAYQPLFRAQTFRKNAEALGADFDSKILAIAGVDALSAQSAQTVQPAQSATPSRSLGERLRPLYRAVAMVAVVLAIGQAAQMPYSDAEAEQQKDFARSVEMLQRIQQDKKSMAVQQDQGAVVNTDTLNAVNVQ